MKIQYKLTAYILSTTIMLLVALSFLFYWHYKDIALTDAKELMQTAAVVESDQLSNLLVEKAKLAIDMTISDTLIRELGRSNSKYGSLSNTKRKSQIDKLNSRWKKISTSEHPFVRRFTHNSVASLLQKKQQALPGEIGEIFLTNRYGLVVGSTNKLTTIAHSHKYWWQAANNNSKGRIFFDDRGYDESVEGYVIGIVVPIKQNNQIIGILKCNFNLLGSLSRFLDDFNKHGNSKAILARSGGRVVLGNGMRPLSTKLSDLMQKTLVQGVAGSAFMNTESGRQLVAYSPVSLTYGSDVYGFGGRYKSADHSAGNTGEGWFIIVTEGIDSVLSPALESARWLIGSGLVFLLLIGVAAHLLGKKAAQPILALTKRVQRIGKGHIDEPLQIQSYDEMGILGKAFNEMTKELKETTVSKDSLEELVEERTKELKTAQSELLRKEKLATLGQLTATVSHELRNPLGAMRPSMFVIQKRSDKKDEKMQQAIERVDRNVTRCDRIIDELLDFTRTTEIETQATNIDAWLNTTLSEITIPKGIELVYQPGLGELELGIDTGRMRRALINIIDNACQAMTSEDNPNQGKKDATLTVTTHLNDGRAEIEVSDTGPGIPDDVLPKIFEPLYSTKTFGVGLGMATIRQIAQQHGGDVEIKSTNSKGTTVGIWLPQTM